MTYTGARDNTEVLTGFFGRLSREFGAMAPAIARVMAEELGDCRLTFPSIADLERQAVEQAIRSRFNGRNIAELSICYELSPRTIRRVLARKITIPIK